MTPMKTKHLIGRCGAVCLVGKNGDKCVECGKVQNQMNQDWIYKRIISEYEKHHRIDWQTILASKLESEFNYLLSEEKEKWKAETREKIKDKRAGEGKVSVFGKGMDSWEARTYDDKALVNAAIKDILKLLE